jgi:hypothetical protein
MSRMLEKYGSSVRTLICGMALLSTAMPTFASAQPAKPAGPGKRLSPEDEARARFNEGITLADANDHEAARLKFNQAWALLKSPVILFNLARSEHLSGHEVEALEHYRLFNKMGADPKVTDQQRQRANENATELSRIVGQIVVEAPAGARVSIDGRPIESIEDPIPVTPGKHEVEAIVDGKVRNVSVDCAAGVVAKARLIDTAPPPSAVPPPASATTMATPKDEPKFWTTGRVVGASAVGVGLVGIGLGAVFHLGAAGAGDDAETIRQGFPPPRDSACSKTPPDSQCQELQSKVDDQHSQEGLRTAFFIGGGAFVLGGAVLFLVSGPSKSESDRRATRVVPTVSARHLGLTMSGSF